MEAFSLKNANLRCIRKQLRDALYDRGCLEKICIGLTNYILAKHGGAQNIPTSNNMHVVDHLLKNHPNNFNAFSIKPSTKFSSITSLTSSTLCYLRVYISWAIMILNNIMTH
jgi:hypothetical protein